MATRFAPKVEQDNTQCTAAEAAAIQALQRGTATRDQQQRALSWIIEKAAGTYVTSYRPGGLEAERASTFAEGRRFVGSLIVGVLKTKIGQ